MKRWYDINGKEIITDDTLYNPFNNPEKLLVLEDDNGNLFLGDYDTPFDDQYQFGLFWEIV